MFALLLAATIAAGPVTPARCQNTQPIVVLWHKDTPSVARATVTHVLADACFKIAEQFDGTRREATEMADLLSLPLLNVKAVREVSEAGVAELVIGLDVIDTRSEELKVIVSADERTPAPARLDARTWRAQGPRIAVALAKVQPSLIAPAARP